MILKAQPIRLAVLGCSGNIKAYRQSALRLRRGSFAMVVDTDRAAAQSMADATGASIVLESLEDALAQHEAYDAVVLRQPLQDRGAAACRLAEAGKHLLVEAPIAASLAEAEKSVDLAGKNKVSVMVGRTLRFLPGNQTILSRLAEKKLGAPGLLRVHRWSSAGARENTLAEQIVGDIDLAICIFAGLPTRVYAIKRKPAYLQIHFGFAHGGMAVLDFARALPEGQGYNSLHVIGSTGAAYADDHHNTHLVYRGGEPRARISGHGNFHIARELQEFVDAIVEKRPSAVGGQDGCKALEVIEAVARSLDCGEPLQWKEDSYGVSDEG